MTLELAVVVHLRGREVGSGVSGVSHIEGGSLATMIGAVETLKARLLKMWMDR